MSESTETRWLAGHNLAGCLPDSIIETDFLGAVQYLVELVDDLWTADAHENAVAAQERWLELHTILHGLLSDPKPFLYTVQRRHATLVFFIDPVEDEIG
jgi:hypothetical protein